MSRIIDVQALEIVDPRGNPTVAATVVLESGARGQAAAPSGASTGSREAVELRDGDAGRYGGKGVSRAVAHANGALRKALLGRDAGDQAGLDQTMIELDGCGSLCRPDRVAKYNRLLFTAAELGRDAVYDGRGAFLVLRQA